VTASSSGLRVGLVAATVALGVLGSVRVAAPQKPAPAGGGLARLTYVERRVEQGASTAGLKNAAENTSLRFGETLKTAPDAMARLEFPWMSLSLSPSSVVSFPDELVLSARLERGRVMVQSGRREILKLVTPEGEVRGRGRAVVRRQGTTTLVSCVDGRFVLAGQSRSVAVAAGQGGLLSGSAVEGPFDLPAAPSGLVPGADPVYVAAGEPASLRWTPRGAAYSIEVLAEGDDVVLVQRDSEGASLSLPIAWPGAFRWRVAARDARGLEGLPSGDGHLVVE
jgi:hypothetical protein